MSALTWSARARSWDRNSASVGTAGSLVAVASWPFKSRTCPRRPSTRVPASSCAAGSWRCRSATSARNWSLAATPAGAAVGVTGLAQRPHQQATAGAARDRHQERMPEDHQGGQRVTYTAAGHRYLQASTVDREHQRGEGEQDLCRAQGTAYAGRVVGAGHITRGRQGAVPRRTTSNHRERKRTLLIQVRGCGGRDTATWLRAATSPRRTGDRAERLGTFPRTGRAVAGNCGLSPATRNADRRHRPARAPVLPVVPAPVLPVLPVVPAPVVPAPVVPARARQSAKRSAGSRH